MALVEETATNPTPVKKRITPNIGKPRKNPTKTKKPHKLTGVTKNKRLETEIPYSLDAEEERVLSPKEIEFCRIYATDREFFGNGIQSYIDAFKPDPSNKNWYNNARTAASKLLTKSYILKKIDEFLQIQGLNDVQVDKELSWVIMQKADLAPKVAAIKEYNILRNRITQNLKLERTVSLSNFKTKDIANKSEEELNAILAGNLDAIL